MRNRTKVYTTLDAKYTKKKLQFYFLQTQYVHKLGALIPRGYKTYPKRKTHWEKQLSPPLTNGAGG